MNISTMIYRSVNYLFRGKATRADSPHTSHKGLGKLYRKGGAPLRNKITINLRHRILSEKITIEKIVKLPADLAREVLESCGLKINNLTLQKVLDVYHPESLAENPSLNVRETAAKNPLPSLQTVANIIILLPKDETQTVHRIKLDFEYEWGNDYPIEHHKKKVYSLHMIKLARDILTSYLPKKREQIMIMVEMKNPEIAWKIKELQGISPAPRSFVTEAEEELDRKEKGPLNSFPLTKDTDILGILFKGGTFVEYYSDGQIHSGTLAKDIEGTEFKAGMKIQINAKGEISKAD